MPAAAFPSPLLPGNLPMGIRHRVKNADGSISTVRTMSIGSDRGEVLIPTVIGGKVVSDADAIAHFEQTGENFGTFRTPDEATAFAKALHNQHERELKSQKMPAATFASPPPKRLSHGVMTSGRRTPQGNAAVGGVEGSWHVSGDAVDYDGPNLNALLQEARQRFPGAKAFIHDGHVHVQDRRIDAPYYGKRGTMGLRGR